MEYLCPDIERLVACYTCGAQSLPPIKLCLSAHVGCASCAKYLRMCICGRRFSTGAHISFDWLVSAIKLKCKYRTVAIQKRVLRGLTVDNDTGSSCADTWYSVNELREHYRSYCTYNAYKCPLKNCGHMARVDTVVDHYETAHGPFEKLMPADHQHPNEVTFDIPVSTKRQMVHKIFNGYFLFAVIPQKRGKARNQKPNVTMQNLNPSDSLNYTYVAVKTRSAARKFFTVTLTITQEKY